jgi:hypothetical protein
MSNEHRSPGVGEGGGTQLEVPWRGPPRWAPAGALCLIVLFLHAACATQGPAARREAGGGRGWEEAAESEARSTPPGRFIELNTTGAVYLFQKGKPEVWACSSDACPGRRLTGTHAPVWLRLASGQQQRRLPWFGGGLERARVESGGTC